MINAESTVFGTVATAFDVTFPKGGRYGEPVDTPAKFPCLTLVEDDNATYEKTQDTALTEHHATIMYTVNCYSNKTSGAKQECKAIMELVDAQMWKMGFTRMFCNQSKNMDSKIYRMTARYRAVINQKFQTFRK